MSAGSVQPTASSRNGDLEEIRAKDGHAFYRLLSRYAPGQWPAIIAGVLTGVVSRLFELGPALLLGISLDTVLYRTRAFELPGWPTAWTPETAEGQLILVAALIGATYLLGSICSWLNNLCWNKAAQQIQHDLRTDTYDAMQTSEVAFFDTRRTGELMSILNNDVNQLEQFLVNGLNMGFRIAVLMGGMATVMLLLNWQLTLVPFVMIPVLGVVSAAFVRRIYPKYQSVRSAVAGLNTRLENNLGGIEVIKAFRQEPYERGRVSEASQAYRDAQLDAINSRIKFFPTLRAITAAGFVATFLVGGWWVIAGAPGWFAGSLTAGTLVTFLLYTKRFMMPMREFGRIVNDLQYAEAASERILGLLERRPEIADRSQSVDPDRLLGRISYEDVTFTYAGEPSPVLDGVDVEIQPGETVGLVGPTGSGKSTLAKLLMRFYDPDEGAVDIDGFDVRDLTLDRLRSNISYVSQDSHLFYGTVRHNIAYAVPDADHGTVEQAAKQAGAHAFIKSLPDGYDTMVGERGLKLSGGQRQRVALARAILTDPAVLILDEATSHVDNGTEAVIQARLAEVTEGRTTLIIAHRLSTVRDADRILVVDGGQLAEEGPHEALMDADGVYAELWKVKARQSKSG